MRRWALRAAVLVVLLAAGLLPLATHVPAGEAAIRARIVAFLQERVTGTVTLARVHGVLPRSLVLEDLRITVDGRPVVILPELELRLAPWELLVGRVHIDRLVLRGLRVRAVDDVRGWHVPTPRRVPPLLLTVDLRRLVVSDARIEVAVPAPGGTRHLAFDAISLAAHAVLTPARRTVIVDALHVHPRGLALGDVELSGRGSFIPGSGVDVEGVTLRSTRSLVTGAGRVDPGRFADARLVLAPLAARDAHAILPADPLLVDLAGTIGVRGAWQALAVTATADLGAGGTIAGAGTVDLSRPAARYAGTATFDGLDPGAAADLVRADARGHARIRGRGHAVAFGVALHDSTVAGAPIVAARLMGRSRDGVHRGHGFAVSTAGAAVGRGRLVTGGEPAYRGAARIAMDDLAALGAGVAGQAEARVTVRGHGLAASARHAAADGTLVGATVAGVRLDGGTLRATLDGERITVDTLALSGPGVRAEGRGLLDRARRVVDATLDASADLSVATRAAAMPLAGAATLHAVAAGSPDAPTLALQLTGTDVGRPRLTVADLHLDSSDTLLGPAAGGRLTLTAHGLAAMSGAAREASAALTWRPAPGGLTATVSDLTLAPEEAPAWHLLRPATLTAAGGVQVEGLVLHAGTQRIALDGRTRRHGPVDATLALSDVAIAPLCTLIDTGPCGGALTSEARLTGTAAAPRLIVDAHLERLAVGEVAYGTLEGHLAYVDRSAAIHAALHAPVAGELLLDGTLPVDLTWDGSRRDLGSAALALALRTQRLDLGFLGALLPAQVRDPHGALTADLRLSGTRAAPHLEGSARLAGGKVGLPATGVTYQEVRAELHGDSGAFTLQARTDDGTLAAEGRLVLDGLRPATIAATIRVDEFVAVQQPAAEARIGGTLTLAGPLGSPLLDGDVLVTHAVVRPALVPSSGVREKRDPTIDVVGLPEALVPPPAAGGPAWSGVGLAVKVRLGRDAWIRRTDADIALGGEVRVTRQPHEPLQLDGRIRLLRGWYDFQGRRFQIEGGTVTFGAPGRSEPLLDVRATYRGPEYLVIVQVGGTLAEPALTLSSDPPLEQADVLAVILFGKPVNALARGESLTLQHQAVSLGTGFVMPDLRTSVLSTLGLSTFDVEMPPETQTAGATPTPGLVRVGSYVSDDLFVSLAQEFGARTGQVFGFEYAFTPKLSLKLSTSTRGSNAIDAFWHRRY